MYLRNRVVPTTAYLSSWRGKGRRIRDIPTTLGAMPMYATSGQIRAPSNLAGLGAANTGMPIILPPNPPSRGGGRGRWKRDNCCCAGPPTVRRYGPVMMDAGMAGLGDVYIAPGSIPSFLSSGNSAPSYSNVDIPSFSAGYILPPIPTYDFSSPTATVLPNSGTATQNGNPAGTSWINNIAGAFSQFGTAWANYKNQAQWNQLQLQRAQQGLPPLSTTGYGAPGVGVNVGVSPQVQQLLIFGGIGLGALLLVNTVAGKRR